MHSITIAYAITNRGPATCDLDGYMLPEWTGTPGSPQPIRPYPSQRAMAAHALRTASGSSIAGPIALNLTSGASAGFVWQGSAPPAAYIPPGDNRPVAAPLAQAVRQGRTLGGRETSVLPAPDTQATYSQALGG